MIALNRAKRRKTEDGRPLRRYRRRWKVERLITWLHSFRRIVTRWEVHVENYVGFVHLGCIRILLRQPAFSRAPNSTGAGGNSTRAGFR